MNTTEEDKFNPESKITVALVDRVSQRRAMGMPLRIALAGESVKCGDYERALSEHPELRDREDLAKQRLIERALGVMLNGKDAAANFRWLIERVYADVIGSGEDEPEEEEQTLLGVPEYLVDELRRQAPMAPADPPPYD